MKNVVETIVPFWHIITYEDYLSEYNRLIKYETSYGTLHLTAHPLFKEDNMTKRKVVDTQTLPLPLPLPEHIIVNGEYYSRQQKVFMEAKDKQDIKVIEVKFTRAIDAIVGRSFILPMYDAPYNTERYKRVRITGFLWNSHVIQDVHSRNDIVILKVSTNSIGCMRGNEQIKYVDE